MNGINIIKIEEKHLASVAELEKACFGRPWSEEALRTLISENGIGFAAVTENGRVVSYAGMVMSLYDGDITDVATLPLFRRRGLSEAVMSEVLRFAEDRGLEAVALEVRASNSAAIALYEKLGFSIEGKRKNFYSAPVEDAYVMVKKIGLSE